MTHEWWDPDGSMCGVCGATKPGRCDVSDPARWKRSPSRTILALAQQPQWRIHHRRFEHPFYRGCPSSVHFLNRKTGKLVKLVDNPERTDYVGRSYHIDPHPRFYCSDQYVVFTTTIRGEIDVAVASVQDLVERTA